MDHRLRGMGTPAPAAPDPKHYLLLICHPTTHAPLLGVLSDGRFEVRGRPFDEEAESVGPIGEILRAWANAEAQVKR